MTPQDQASELARWLADHPGAEPPEGLDAEVVEAVYALRPDLAPAPRVSVDDILAGVTTGPFALRTTGNEVAELAPSELSPANQVPGVDGALISFSAAAARRKKRQLWVGVGALAAAAMALVVVVPSADQLPGPRSVMEEATLEAPPPPAAAPAGGEAMDAPSLDNVAPPKREAMPSATPRPAAEPEPEQQAAQASRYEVLSLGDGDDQGVGELASAPEAASSGSSAGGASAGAPSAGGVGAGQATSSARPSPLEPVADVSATRAPNAPQKSSAFADDALSPAQGRTYSSDERRDEADVAEVESSGRDRQGLGGLLERRGSETSNMATPAPQAEAAAGAAPDYAYDVDADDVNAEEEWTPPAPLPEDLAGLRALAWPGDYSDGWWSGSSADPRMRPALDAAGAAAASGDLAGASAACEALISDPSAPVGQDMAWRAARYAAQAGSSGRALTLIAQGKQRSSANSAYLARLYALEGELLEAQGQTEAARAAYRTAAVLNQAR